MQQPASEQLDKALIVNIRKYIHSEISVDKALFKILHVGCSGELIVCKYVTGMLKTREIIMTPLEYL